MEGTPRHPAMHDACSFSADMDVTWSLYLQPAALAQMHLRLPAACSRPRISTSTVQGYQTAEETMLPGGTCELQLDNSYHVMLQKVLQLACEASTRVISLFLLAPSWSWPFKAPSWAGSSRPPRFIVHFSMPIHASDFSQKNAHTLRCGPVGWRDRAKDHASRSSSSNALIPAET